MTIYRWLTIALWLGLMVYWAVSSMSAKRSLGPRQTWNGIGLRLIVVALVLIVLAVPPVRQTFRDLQAYQEHEAWFSASPASCCAVPAWDFQCWRGSSARSPGCQAPARSLRSDATTPAATRAAPPRPASASPARRWRPHGASSVPNGRCCPRRSPRPRYGPLPVPVA